MIGLMKSRLDDPSQLTFPVFCPVVIPMGNGTFKMEVGKPVFWLSPKQMAAQFGVVRETVYLWIQDGTIPPGLWERGGKLKLRISSEAVAVLREKFNRDRGL